MEAPAPEVESAAWERAEVEARWLVALGRLKVEQSNQESLFEDRRVLVEEEVLDLPGQPQ